MLKKRIIASILIKDGVAVQSRQFKDFLPIGKPKILVEFLNNWGVDEILLLDISLDRFTRGPNIQLLKEIAVKCHVPLTVGGGISNIEHVKTVINAGADKIAINTMAFRQAKFIETIVHIFGSQAVVVSIDYLLNKHISIDSARVNLDMSVFDAAFLAEKCGAGEVLIRSIDNDGSKKGFDTSTISNIADNLKIPVIAASGAGSPQHFAELFLNTKAAAAVAGNFFNFTEHSVVYTKAYLRQIGMDVRIDTEVNYSKFTFGDDGRILSISEEELQALKFIHVDKEVI
jgi:imidazole glycerol-phosphate synthase subunit HisF